MKMKKILGFMMVLLLSTAFIGRISAETLLVNSVVEEFKKTDIFVGLSELGAQLDVKTEDNMINIYEDADKIMSFKYGEDYIEYDNRDTVVSKDNYLDTNAIWVLGMLEAVLKLSGIQDKAPREDVDYSNAFDEYGLNLEIEHYDFSGSDDNGHWTIKGDYIKYFKISLDTEKINKLIETYGEDVEDANKDILENLTPSLELKEVTSNSVTLKPSINYTNTDPEYVVACNIYRATSIDGVYEKISDKEFNCLNNDGIVDTNLESNKTYFYKALLLNGKNYSNIIEVTTKKSEENVTTNPKTGISTFAKQGLILIILSLGALVFAKPRKLFD